MRLRVEIHGRAKAEPINPVGPFVEVSRAVVYRADVEIEDVPHVIDRLVLVVNGIEEHIPIWNGFPITTQ